LPSIPLGGVASVNGYLVLGIGTQSNNVPSGVSAVTVDALTGDFTTDFSGKTMGGFLDSGSNGLFFPTPCSPSLADCSSIDPSAAGYYCPSSVVSLSANTTSATGTPSYAVPFQIGGLQNFDLNNHHVFLEFGANMSVGGSSVFDWGLPFYFGRNVYVGFEGSSSTAFGPGPYWAY
jgi:hypothetical protein